MCEEIKLNYKKTLEIIEIDIMYMRRNMAVFKKLRQLAKFQGEIISGLNWFLRWIESTYTTDVAMSIRRLVDIHPDPHCKSLIKFLKELKINPLNLVDLDELQRDIDYLDGDKNPQLKNILRFTCQDRAHSDDRMKKPEGVNLPQYADISFDDDVFPEIENIEKIFIKYYISVNDDKPKFMKNEYIKHDKIMIDKIDNTFRRICNEKIKDQ